MKLLGYFLLFISFFFAVHMWQRYQCDLHKSFGTQNRYMYIMDTF